MPQTKNAVDLRRGRLQSLRSFCHAAQLGSISRAAEEMELSQPSVSLQIQALEQQLNTALFQRRGPKIVLTADGQALYELARPLVEALDDLPIAFQEARRGQETGRLHIAAGESTLLYLLPEYLRGFASVSPGIELKLHHVTGREGLRLLRQDAVDLAVGPMTASDIPEDLLFHPTYHAAPMLITPRDHPLARLVEVTLPEVAQYPLILPPQHQTTWREVDAVFQRHRLSYRIALEVGGWEVIKRYVEVGLGIAIVTGLCLTGKEALAAIPFDRYFPRKTYGIVSRKGKVLSRPARRFLDLIPALPQENRASPSRNGAPKS
jgi:DNA-binding transcriptional LysR family regulator